MKKKTLIAIIAAAAVIVITLAIVLPIVLTNKGGEPMQLVAPTGVSASTETKTLTWNAVEHASGYIVSVDSAEKPQQTATSYDLASLTEGTYSLKVMAVGDGTHYTNSPWSAVESYTISGENPPLTAPTAPQNFTAVAGNAQVVLTWTVPSSDGGATITKYEVSSDNGASWTTASGNTGHTFTGLTNGTEYIFKVRAVNSVGNGTESAGQNVTPTAAPTIPSAVQNLNAVAGNAEVVLSWTTPISDGNSAITGYEVKLGSGSWISASSSINHTFFGLTNGTEYTFYVRAVNAIGNGAESITTATPATVPTQPRSLVAVSGNQQVTLSWEAPSSDGGSAITGYEVSGNGGASWTAASSHTSHTFTGLTNGILTTFSVRAVNAMGSGASASKNAKAYTTPSAPQNFAATAGNAQVTLSWTALSGNAQTGGDAITRYEVSSNNGSTWTTTSSNTGHTFTGLSNGTTYTFKVRAVNAAGNGAESSITATPVAPPVPTAPQGFYATSLNASVALFWTAPSNDGGSAIIKYEVSSNGGSSWVDATSSTGHTFNGLTNGTLYTFKVRAVTANGAGAESTTTSTPATLSNPPQNFTATPGNAQVVLSWTAPNDNGGSPITSYQVSKDNGSTYVTADSNTGHTFTGLTNGTLYNFRVRAVTSVGNGAAATASATPVAPASVPGVPQNFDATPGDTQVILSWTAPASDGGATITKYEVSSNAGVSWVTASSNTNHTFTGLTNGVTYTFRVRAVNSAGNGAEAQATATPVVPATAPTVPQNFSAVAGNAQVVLSWTAPASDGGSAITKYEVSSNNGSTWVNASSSIGHIFTGLSNGTTYTFKVRAVNTVGNGAESSATATPITTATAPQSFVATPGNEQVVLSWTAPASDGGSAITTYQVSSNNGSTWTTAASSTEHTFIGLTNGTLYTFKVRAVNAAGNGLEATATATPVAPATVPAAPQNFSADAQDTEVVLSWTAPASNGGSAITGYQVSSNNGSTWVSASSSTGHTFTGLTNGIAYTFKVRAVNAIGNGSEATATATPEAMTIFTTTTDGNGVTITGIKPAHAATQAIVIPARIGGVNVYTIGNNAFKDNTSITSVQITSGLTRIYSTAFTGCTNLTSLDIPASVTTIFAGGFGGGITVLTVSGSNTTYAAVNNYIYKKASTSAVLEHGCKGTTISATVTTLATSAFSGCDGLTSITVPNTVTTINANVFAGCPLTFLTLPFLGENSSTAKVIGHFFSTSAYPTNSSVVPSSLKTVTINSLGSGLTNGAFQGCAYIQTVNMPNGGVPTNAFKGCTALANLNMTITAEVGEWAFEGCIALTSVAFNTVGNNIIIKGAAFKSSGLTSVNLRGITAVWQGAFEGCNSMTRMDIDKIEMMNGGILMGNGPLSYFFKAYVQAQAPDAQQSHNATLVPASLTTVIFYGNLTYMTGNTFNGCAYIETFVWRTGAVTNIYNGTFANMASLRTLVLPNYTGTELLNNNAFTGTTLTNLFFNGNQSAYNTRLSKASTLANATNKYYTDVNTWSYDGNGLPVANNP